MKQQAQTDILLIGSDSTALQTGAIPVASLHKSQPSVEVTNGESKIRSDSNQAGVAL